jgi:DNA-binding NarL/FixJ family response regulator
MPSVTPGTSGVDYLRAVIADNDQVLLDAVCSALRTGHVVVVGALTDPSRLVATIRHERPDVVAVDAKLATIESHEILRRLIRLFPKLPIVIMQEHPEETVIRSCLALGVHGFTTKAEGLGELTSAMVDVARGAVHISSLCATAFLQGLARGSMSVSLSLRECEILKWVAEGRTTKQAAAGLGISPRTAEAHRASLMRKLGIHDTAGLVRFAVRSGVIVA